MRYILVSDVFGRTQALEEIARLLSGCVEIYDPYQSKNMDFKNETEAYKYFVLQLGLDSYAIDLQDLILSKNDKVCLIGFSVGASAIWKISDTVNNNIVKAVCFYGSQIRHYKNIAPRFPIKLILPCSEEHFSISALISHLSNKDNIEIERTKYFHGFMNRHSGNFNDSAYKKYIQVLSEIE